MPADGVIHHLCCGRKYLRPSSLKNKIHIPLHIIKGIHDVVLIVFWFTSPITWPTSAFPALCAIPQPHQLYWHLFPTQHVFFSLAGAVSWLPLGKLCFSTYSPHGLGGVDTDFNLPSWVFLVGGSIVCRWEGASSCINQNQPVVFQELLGNWCHAGWVCVLSSRGHVASMRKSLPGYEADTEERSAER